MGKYINQNSKGKPLGVTYQEKLTALLADGAKLLKEQPKKWIPNLICIVDNAIRGKFFAACGYVHDEIAFRIFTRPDAFNPQRPRTWLIYPHAEKVAK